MISIIIPVYNQANKLEKCLQTIKSQVYKNYEIIIVDDGSSDNLDDVVHKNKSNFESFFYFKQENKGAPSARNLGKSKARGEYLFFCDADARLRDDCLAVMHKNISQNKNISYVYSSFYWGRKKFKLFPFDEQKLKKMPYIHTMSLIRAKDFPKSGWDENIKKLQDWDLYLTMLEDGKKGFWIDDFLFKIDPGGTMSSWLPSFAYKIMPFLPEVKKYKRAMQIIKTKHGI